MYEIVIIHKEELEKANYDMEKILAEKPAGKDLWCDKKALEDTSDYLQFHYGDEARVVVRKAPVKFVAIPYKPISKIRLKGGE